MVKQAQAPSLPPLVVSKKGQILGFYFPEAVPQIASELLFLFLQMHDRSKLEGHGGTEKGVVASLDLRIPAIQYISGTGKLCKVVFRIVGGRRHGADDHDNPEGALH